MSPFGKDANEMDLQWRLGEHKIILKILEST